MSLGRRHPAGGRWRLFAAPVDERRLGAAPIALLALVVLGGLGLRLWLLHSSIGGLDSDEAVTTLMAEGFLDGDANVFFWGQSYGGSLDAILTAPVLAVFPGSVLAAKLVMVCLQAVACVVVWRVGSRLFGPTTGALAGVLAWVLSSGVVWYSTKTRGFYGSSLVLAMLAVLLALRLADRRGAETPTSRGGWRRLVDDADVTDLALLGLVVGLGVWVSPLTFFVIGPVLAFVGVSRPDLIRRVGWAVPGFVLGAAPWLAFNLAKGFPSLDQPPASVPSSYSGRLSGFVTRLVPTLLGFREPYSGEWLGGRVGQVGAVIVMVGIVVVAFAVRRRSWLPLLVVVGYGVVFAVPAATYYVDEPRYGYILAPVLALLVAVPLARAGPAGFLVPVVVLGATTVGLVGLRDWGADHPGHWDLDPPAVSALVAELDGRGIDAAYAEYWIAYRLTFESDLVVSPIDGVRNEDLALEASRRGAADVWIWYSTSPGVAAQVTDLEARGVGYRRTDVGPFVVIDLD